MPQSLRDFEKRWSNRNHPLDFSGVWRFRELLPFSQDDQIITIGEGQTMLKASNPVAQYAGLNNDCLYLQYEGLNPSGSFKDNGMTAASTHACMVGAKVAACASTGNTSASLAVYSSVAQKFKVVVFVGSGKIAFGNCPRHSTMAQKPFRFRVTLMMPWRVFAKSVMQKVSICVIASIHFASKARSRLCFV